MLGVFFCIWVISCNIFSGSIHFLENLWLNKISLCIGIKEIASLN